MIEIINEQYSLEERQEAYNDYLSQHIGGVRQAFEDYLADYLGTQLSPGEIEELRCQLSCHDKSKYESTEYQAYLDHFYAPETCSVEDEESPEFVRAWMHHQKVNPHHWQYWVVINDSPEDGRVKFTPVDMDFKYIIEMLCDWSSFQYQGKGTAKEWYNEIKSFILLSPKTREIVERILDDCPGL